MDQPLVIRDTRQTGNNWSLALTVTSDFKSESGATLPNILKFRTNHRLQDIPEVIDSCSQPSQWTSRNKYF